MNSPHHFKSFSFVDRIAAVTPGASIRGNYSIPSAVREFPGPLVAEATGQLAAWVAMAAVDFKARPVAGIAGLVEILAPVNPGQTLELAADIESLDSDAIAYRGVASVKGSPVLRLHNCVGPMLPAEEFDDPRSLRERFALLCGVGAEPGAFAGNPELDLQNVSGSPGQVLRATLPVPTHADFFADHFPRKPVFPGSLLMQFNLRLVAQVAAAMSPPAGASAWKLDSVSDMKLRTFISPGEMLELEVKLEDRNETAAEISIVSRRGKKPAGSARARLAAI